MHKTKTFWASITAAIGALAGYYTGDLTVAEALQLVVTALLAVFLRHGVSKSESAAKRKPAGSYASGDKHTY